MEQFLNYSDVDLLGLIVGNKNYSLPDGVDFLELMENPVEYLTEKQSLKLAACSELHKRKMQAKTTKKRIKVISSTVAHENFKHLLEHEQREKFYVLFLNRSNVVKNVFEASAGGVGGTVVDVKIIAKKAINLLASGVIVMHNHPSGNTLPSQEDKNITAKLKQTLSIMDINLLDHLIITDQNYLSFADEGLL